MLEIYVRNKVAKDHIKSRFVWLGRSRIERKKRKAVGHSIRKEREEVVGMALDWNPQGLRRLGKSKSGLKVDGRPRVAAFGHDIERGQDGC